MLTKLIDKMDCEICGGPLELDTNATIEDYAIAVNVDATNIFEKIDEIIGKYLIYECSSCQARYKYTYRELEKSLRKSITQKMLLLLVHGTIVNNNALHDKLFFYCGKCNGYDGKGSCPKTVYNKCEIKRFPLNEL